MRILVLCLFAILPAAAQQIEKLGFMSGCWAFTAGEMTVEEQWNRPAGGLMLGTSRTLKGGRTVFHEFMRIDEKDGVVQYTPRVGQGTPVSFRLVKLDGEEAVFENLAHDFPQRVIYQRSGDAMPARIEGMRKGAPAKQEFPYRRVACP